MPAPVFPPIPLPILHGAKAGGHLPLTAHLRREVFCFLFKLYNPVMEIRTLLYTRRAEILAVAACHGATNVRVFGSVARGDDHSGSDVDLLVDMEPGHSLFDLGGLLIDLQRLLGLDVDVVTEKGLRPRIRAEVLREAVPL
jgi:uncharacterized protein